MHSDVLDSATTPNNAGHGRRRMLSSGLPCGLAAVLLVLCQAPVQSCPDPEDPCDATCPGYNPCECSSRHVGRVNAPDVPKCVEATATISLSSPPSENVLIEVTIQPPDYTPPEGPYPGDAVFVDAGTVCDQGEHTILACILQGQTSTTVTYRGEEETDGLHPMIMQACIATDECPSAFPDCTGTCDPTNCATAFFHVTPMTYQVNIDWSPSNPTNMISVNGDYDENQPGDQRDNEGDPKIVGGDDELKTIKIDITGTPGVKGKWQWTGASNVKLWKSLTEEMPMGQASEEITIPYSVTLTMEGISPSGSLDGTTLSAYFTPSPPCIEGPATDHMSFTVVLAEVNTIVLPDKYEEDHPGELLCPNDDYDEGGPLVDNADADPVHNTTGDLVLEEMVAPELIVEPNDAAFRSAVKVELACPVGRVFGVDDTGGVVQWEVIGGSDDISNYFGAGPKSEWDIRMEGISGSDLMTIVVKRGEQEVAGDQARYTVGEMTVAPASGQIGTVITITACGACSGEFDDDTTVSFTGVFEPDGGPATPELSVSYSADEVYYDPASPDQVKIILGDALPGDPDFWTNPGVLARATGLLRGTIEAESCATGSLFQVLPSDFGIGYALLSGGYEAQDPLIALPINDSTDVFFMADPDGDASYTAQIVVTIGGSPPQAVSAPSTLSATIRTRAPDGELLSSGVTTTLELYSSSGNEFEYRSAKIILFTESPLLEGEFPEAVVVNASEDNASVEILVEP